MPDLFDGAPDHPADPGLGVGQDLTAGGLSGGERGEVGEHNDPLTHRLAQTLLHTQLELLLEVSQGIEVGRGGYP